MLLQWGRNFAVAETQNACGEYKMVVTLQWGRNFAVAETMEAMKHAVEIVQLQWGRNFAVAETRIMQNAPRHLVCRFNGAATLQLRKQTHLG